MSYVILSIGGCISFAYFTYVLKRTGVPDMPLWMLMAQSLGFMMTWPAALVFMFVMHMKHLRDKYVEMKNRIFWLENGGAKGDGVFQ